MKQNEFDCIGNYMDEADVREKYKNKPELVAWMLANAQTIERQGQILYECLSFKSTTKDREENIEEHHDTIRKEEKVKQEAKSKPKAKAKSEP